MSSIRIPVLLLVSVVAPGRATAEESPAPPPAPVATPEARALPESSDHLSLGFQIGRFHDEFTLGVQLTSPFVFDERLALRLSGNLAFVDGLTKAANEAGWHPYGSLRLGLIGAGGRAAGVIRLYGEGGIVVNVGTSALSEDFSLGGYGVFGFEFFMGPEAPVAYFLEMGGVGTGAHATKLVGDPSFMNGFMAMTGVRFYP